jgi:hypothetical protein
VGGGRLALGPSLCPYSPERVEEVSCELLRPNITRKVRSLMSSTIPFKRQLFSFHFLLQR